MFLANKLSKSLKTTLKQTDVWSKNSSFIFKLEGAGTTGHESKDIKRNMGSMQQPVNTMELLKSQHKRKTAENNSSQFGHAPLRTIRDNKTFTQASVADQNDLLNQSKLNMSFYDDFENSVNEKPFSTHNRRHGYGTGTNSTERSMGNPYQIQAKKFTNLVTPVERSSPRRNNNLQTFYSTGENKL